MTPIFRIFNYSQALEFYITWLGFQIDWEEPYGTEIVYLQVSRDNIVLHLAAHPPDACPGAKARAEMRGLPAYHRRLLARESVFKTPDITQADWNNRVLELEILDPFGNLIIFCEPSGGMHYS